METMNNLIISPLTKDERNQLRGGFGLIRIETGLSEGNKNVNCDQKASNGDENTNCSDKCKCDGTGGGGLQVNIGQCFCEPPVVT